MELKSISSLSFKVNDINKTKEFYEKLGFRFTSTDPEGQLTAYVNWFSVKFYQEAADGPRGEGQATYLKVISAAEAAKELESRGIEILSGPEKAADGSQQVIIADPDGYQLILFEK